MFGVGEFVAAFGWLALSMCCVAMAAGGFAKGVVGFALPLIALSIMASFLPGKVAVALLVVPILVSNLFQATRDGMAEAWDSLMKFWRLNLMFVVTIALVAQLVVLIPDPVMFGVLGVVVTGFGLSQMVGWRARFPARFARPAEVFAGFAAGVFGGIAGIWGPPIILYLLAIEMPKAEMIRVQSLTFLIGALVLLGAHIHSGILNAVTLPVSAWLVVPAVAAMFVGYGVQDRLDQALFRKVTLIVLIVSGLNLMRRAFGV